MPPPITADAFFEGNAGSVAELGEGERGVGPRALNVAGLRGQAVDHGGLADHAFYRGDELGERHGMFAADVINTKPGPQAVQRG
jgi:hypothetical protein